VSTSAVRSSAGALDVPVVILAGGKGRRLKPYSNVFPKPLMPVGERPILEILIRQLARCGLRRIYIAVGHLSHLLINFFGDGSELGVHIEYVREAQPLGTAGALSLLRDRLDSTFLLMNGDLLTDLDYGRLLDDHAQHRSCATIALAERTVDIDYGVIRVDDEKRLVGYDEKPQIKYLVSMGIYALEPRVLREIAPDTHHDFPSLVLRLLAEHETVRGFMHTGYWLDIGRPSDYELANEWMQEQPERFDP